MALFPMYTFLASYTIRKIYHTLWLSFHFHLPALYRSEYKIPIPLPQLRLQGFGRYQNYVTLGDHWCSRAGRLHGHWIIFRDISMVLLGVIAPYLGTTRTPSHSMTFALGSLCIFYSFISTILAHVYIGNAQNMRKALTVDYWLEASGRDRGLWFWTLLSLPAVWFTTSITSFIAFLLASVWEGTSHEAPNNLYTRLAFLHRGILCLGVMWACLHFAMIVITWVRIRNYPTNQLR